ncbi:MAG: hypothetical protein ABI895_22775 [Deltaproteobacteria bacterium]
MNQSIHGISKETVDVVSLFKRSWALFSQKPLEHLVASLIVVVLGSLSVGLLIGPLGVGQIRMVDKQQRGEEIIIQDVFSGFSSFGAALIVTLIFLVSVAIGTSILVLPGLFIIAAWGFSWFFVALHDASATDALARSWNLLKTQTTSVLVVLVLIGVVNAVAGTVVLAVLLSAPLTAIFCTLAFRDMTAGSAPSASAG